MLRILGVVALLILVAGTMEAFALDYDPGDLTRLESRVDDLEGRPMTQNGTAGGAAFLFGAFCALWAQNTGRNAWLWFFLGLFFSVITVIVLLVRNSNDRKQAATA